MKRSNFFLIPLLMIAQMGCVWEPGPDPATLPYYRPVYASKEQMFKVQTHPARALQNPGRIYLKDNLLIINERYKGFHLIDNADPADPKPLLFLEVPGAVNMAMQGQYLYADNLTDLIAIDLGNLQNIKEVSRKKNVFEGQQLYPPYSMVSFECVDAGKGIVIGWEEAQNPGKPECWR